MKPNEKSELVFYIRHQHGFTKKLYEYALEHPGAEVSVLVDGPYGGVNMQKYYDGDHSLVVAGGSGAGWILPFVERFVRDQSPNSIQDEEKALDTSIDSKETPTTDDISHTRRNDGPSSLRVILVTRDTHSRTWFLRIINDLLSKYPSPTSSSKVNIQVFLTGSASHQIEISSPNKETNIETTKSSTNSTDSLSSGDEIAIPTKQENQQYTTSSTPGKEFKGRPQLPSIIRDEAERLAEERASMGVFVCGPVGMLNDVRNAVAAENLGILKGGKSGGVYLHSEHFSWA